MSIESLEFRATGGRRRRAAAAIAVSLVAGVVAWNLVFDRAVESAEQRYLALARQHPMAVTIRQVMDPAVHDAAVRASAWAGALATGALIAVFVATRFRRGRRPVAPPGQRAARPLG